MSIYLRLDSAGEVMVKRENDPWIVVKRSDMRELILTINQKNANLKEISGKINFLLDLFRRIFLILFRENQTDIFYTI